MENKNDILKADQDNGYIQYGEYTAMDIGQDKAGQNRIASGRLAGGGVLAGKKRQPVHSHFQRAALSLTSAPLRLGPRTGLHIRCLLLPIKDRK